MKPNWIGIRDREPNFSILEFVRRCKIANISCVVALPKGHAQFLQLRAVDETLGKGHFFWAGYPKPLPSFECRNEISSFKKTIRCPSIQPGKATAHPLDGQLTARQVDLVQIGNF